ncbi:MAG: hypothetical protein FOGNACKC_04207 [Anaerolineae bacterium]|nr:hypothetical protein [Anaerolineae bacterium]
MMTRFVLPAAAVITAVVCLVFYEQVARLVLILGYTALGVLATIALAIGFFGSWILTEKIKMLRAHRIEAEKHAHVMTITDNGETWVRDTDPNAVYRNLTGSPSVHINGQNNQPTDLEIDLYRYRLAVMRRSPKVIEGSAELLPPQTSRIDLLTALDGVQRGLIVGASDSGKTTLLQWLVYRRKQVSKVVVIDPHAYPGKWAGCYVIGTGRNYAEIDRALAGLVQVMTKRYDEIGRGVITEGNHPRLTILIDEWRAIVHQLGRPASDAIKALLTESRKAAFSVFVASHSDRAKPLGLEGEYDLKDGFAIVRLALINGERQATIDTGNGEQPAMLPGSFTATQQAANLDFELDLTPQPAKADEQAQQDALFVQLVNEGMSRRQAALQAYGKEYAGALVTHCKNLLGEI